MSLTRRWEGKKIRGLCKEERGNKGRVINVALDWDSPNKMRILRHAFPNLSRQAETRHLQASRRETMRHVIL